MNNCGTYIKPEYISDYQKYHRSICLNLNRMIWNVAFLKKAKEAQDTGAPCRNDFVIEHLFKNEFELLILRLHRTLLDEGADTMTLPHLKNHLFSKFLFPEKKAELRLRLQSCSWDGDEIVAARRRIEETVPTFRTHFIAHTLFDDSAALSVSLLDAEKVILSACEYLEKLSFGLEDFYHGLDRGLMNFQGEKEASEKFIENFLMYQQTSAWCVSEIICKCTETEDSHLVYDRIAKITALLCNE